MLITAAPGASLGGLPEDIVYIGLVDIFQAPDELAGLPVHRGPTPSNNALTHNDQHAFAFNPLNPEQALVGNDGESIGSRGIGSRTPGNMTA